MGHDAWRGRRRRRFFFLPSIHWYAESCATLHAERWRSVSRLFLIIFDASKHCEEDRVECVQMWSFGFGFGFGSWCGVER